MKIYIFGSTAKIVSQSKIRTTLEHVARGTDCNDLVVVLYLSARSRRIGGRAYVRQWMQPHQLHPKGGHWTEFSRFPVPPDPPAHFKLIRLMLCPESAYPRTETDAYRWRHTFAGFYDHLAHLFAHELHHYRRYHLDLHPGEGEHSANKWAYKHALQLGYSIQSKKLPNSRKHRVKKRRISLSSVFNPADFNGSILSSTLNSALKRAYLMLSPQAQNDYIADKLAHFERLRALQSGDQVIITFDPQYRYSRQTAIVARVMRKNSLRMIIRTRDGKEWRWPMAWLDTAISE